MVDVELRGGVADKAFQHVVEVVAPAFGGSARPGHADQRKFLGQHLGAREIVECRHHQALGQVAGGPENHHGAGIALARLAPRRGLKHPCSRTLADGLLVEHGAISGNNSGSMGSFPLYAPGSGALACFLGWRSWSGGRNEAIEASQYSRKQIWQILGHEARPEVRGRGAVQPRRRGRGKEGLHALGEEAEQDSAQNIARPRGGQCGRRVRVDDCPSIRCRNHRIRAFQDDDGATPASGGARTGEFVAARVEQTAELPVMAASERKGRRWPDRGLGDHPERP